jgi:hypothetical protein
MLVFDYRKPVRVPLSNEMAREIHLRQQFNTSMQKTIRFCSAIGRSSLRSMIVRNEDFINSMQETAS